MDSRRNGLMSGFDKTLCMTAILVVELGNTKNIKEINE
jgi:hypothetical protein